MRELEAALRARGGGLIVRHAFARDAIPELATALGASAVYANHDYEPAACARDAAVAQALAARGISFRTTKDQVIFERDEVLSQAGPPFSVFTPYRNAWLGRLTPSDVRAHAIDRCADALAPPPPDLAGPIPTLEAMGFRRTNLKALGIGTGMSAGAALAADFRERIDRYKEARDFPAARGPSYLSVHLRFGTVSIRELVAYAHLRSLRAGRGWRGDVALGADLARVLRADPLAPPARRRACVQAAVRRDAFPDDPAMFAAWREGRTGYPIVDAAMRQINASGYMHNRLRMIAASFLVKDLLVDWRRGETIFRRQLLDYDLASNNGGWQWAASTGCDAQPYFRIFNPVTQSERFDPAGKFIRRYVPELAPLDAKQIHAPWLVAPAVQRAKGVVIGRDYPAPIVDHAVARRAALALFAKARAA